MEVTSNEEISKWTSNFNTIFGAISKEEFIAVRLIIKLLSRSLKNAVIGVFLSKSANLALARSLVISRIITEFSGLLSFNALYVDFAGIPVF